MSEARLDVAGVVVAFGGLKAVDDVSFVVAPGETFGIIGPNGAGKTTLLNAVSGLVPLQQGTVRLDGAELHGLRPDQRTARGVSRTFQAAEVFNEFRVRDYVSLGRLSGQRQSVVGAALRLPGIIRAERAERADVERLLATYGLSHIADEVLRELPYGVRKLVDILRALFGRPLVLLLDEPTSGTATSDRVALREALQQAGQDGLTTVVVDHDVQFVSDLCDRLLVVDFGQELGTGAPAEVLARADVRAAYVGAE
jgi:branched-chain amino acid transport system ATP-binding protein